jgi:hypothetical protein
MTLKRFSAEPLILRWNIMLSKDSNPYSIDRAKSERRRMIFTNASAPSASTSDSQGPSRDQLQRLFVQAAVPMIGFGFIDNVVMITVIAFSDVL